MATDIDDFNWSAGKSAVHVVEMVVPHESRNAYFSQLRAFANENKFGLAITTFPRTKDQYTIELWRADIALSGDNEFDPQDFELAFYIDPNRGGTLETALELLKSLNETVATVPGITIKQTK